MAGTGKMAGYSLGEMVCEVQNRFGVRLIVDLEDVAFTAEGSQN